MADGLDIELESSRAILREVRITPYNIIINADYIEKLAVSPSPIIVMNTTSGTVTPVAGSTMLMNRFDDSNETLVGFTVVRDLVDVRGVDIRETELFDIDSIISVEIEGHIIEF